MLQLGNKRIFDSLDSPSNPILDIESPYLKKRRNQTYLPPPSPSSNKKFIDDNDFTTDWTIHCVDEDTFLQWVPKRRRAKYLQVVNKQENIFSANDVKTMITTAIEETKKKVEEEFNNVLEKKLKEQLEVLSRVVNENVNRQLENSTHDYMV